MMNDQYFPHDATAANNIKLMELIATEGPKGYGLYWILLEFLRQQQGYIGRLEMLDMLARRVRTNRRSLERIITDYSLFVVKDLCFYSPGLSERMQPLDKRRATKHEQSANAARVKWLKINDSVDAGALQEKKNQIKKRREENIITPQTPLPEGPKEEKKEGGGDNSVLMPPAYALNKQTHNFERLEARLMELKVHSPQEINAIYRMSDFGRKETKVWEVLYHTDWKKIKVPGRFLISILRQNSS